MIKRLFEEHKYKKKYDELLSIVSKVLVEKQQLKEENDFFREQIKRLTKERNKDGLTK